MGEEKTFVIGEIFPLVENPNEYQFEIKDDTIANVDDLGRVTGIKVGSTEIKIIHNSTKKEQVYRLNFKKPLSYHNELPTYRVQKKWQQTIEKSPYTKRQYLGQPDLIQTKTGRLILAYPIGHGKGPLVLQISDDRGKTWHESKKTPKSWETSQETPTLYTLNKSDGQEVLLLITACPGNWGDYTTGWNTSLSYDNGQTWSEYKHWHSEFENGEKNPSVVGMASLIQMRDKEGNEIDKWLGVYHSPEFVNYKTYLTFDENGREQWSEPIPYLEKYRQQEMEYQMCEVGMLRLPDENTIIGISRSQSHRHLSTFIVSYDEGETWTKPKFLPGSLVGERHKLFIDPKSGKLCISFRSIWYDLNRTGIIEDDNDWKAGNWTLWIGETKDLFQGNEGEYRISLGEDYSPNEKGGDTGYAGVTTFADGLIVLVSYGHWDKIFSSQWTGDVRSDLSYIKQVRGLLEELINK